VVAEGIETQEQLAFLQAQHCAEGQGYHFSRPLAAAQFARLLQMGLTETVVH
jgi:EAL domain-containing protein (putative c-di-GMP-specific phosphodiesterase class I)